MGHPETNDLGDTDATKTVTLTERDVRDAARLFRLLADPTLTSGMPALFPVPIQTGLGTGQEALISKARIVLNSRRLRERYFASELFGEPAWDILLSLYIAEKSSGRMTTSRLAEQIHTPMTTVVRWLNHLETNELIERQAHPTDRRTAFIKLLRKGRTALDSYLESIPG